jgi:hypothetical protein
MVVRVVVCVCPAVWQRAAVCSSALCAAVRAAVCGIMWLCVAVRLIVCGNAHGSVRAVRAIVYGSALGSIWQCAVACGCPAVRLVVCGIAHGSAVRLCGSAAECGSVRQCERLCAAARAAV